MKSRKEILQSARDASYQQLKTYHYRWYRKAVATASAVCLTNKIEGKAAAEVEAAFISYTLEILNASPPY